MVTALRIPRHEETAVTAFGFLVALAGRARANPGGARIVDAARISIIARLTFVQRQATIATLVFRVAGAHGALALAGIAASVANPIGLARQPLTRVLDCTSKHIVTTRRLALRFGQQLIAWRAGRTAAGAVWLAGGGKRALAGVVAHLADVRGLAAVAAGVCGVAGAAVGRVFGFGRVFGGVEVGHVALARMLVGCGVLAGTCGDKQKEQGNYQNAHVGSVPGACEAGFDVMTTENKIQSFANFCNKQDCVMGWLSLHSSTRHTKPTENPGIDKTFYCDERYENGSSRPY